MVKNSININKTKFKQWWSRIPPISTKQKKALTLLIMMA